VEFPEIIKDHDMIPLRHYRIIKVNDRDNLENAGCKEIVDEGIVFTKKDFKFIITNNPSIVVEIEIVKEHQSIQAQKIEAKKYYKIIETGNLNIKNLGIWKSLGVTNPKKGLEFFSLKSVLKSDKGFDGKVQQLSLLSIVKSSVSAIERGKTFYGAYGFQPMRQRDKGDDIHISPGVADVYYELFADIMKELNIEKKDLLLDSKLITKTDIKEIVKELKASHKSTIEKLEKIRSHSKFVKYSAGISNKDSSDALVAQKIIELAIHAGELTLKQAKDKNKEATDRFVSLCNDQGINDIDENEKLKEIYSNVKESIKDKKSKNQILSDLSLVVLEIQGLSVVDLNIFYELSINDPIEEDLNIVQVISLEECGEEDALLDDEYNEEIKKLKRLAEEYKPGIKDVF
jgi:hypothetical protein